MYKVVIKLIGVQWSFVELNEFLLWTEIIVCWSFCYTVLTMYMADNKLLDMYSYTFYPLRDPPHKSPTTHSKQGSQRNQ